MKSRKNRTLLSFCSKVLKRCLFEDVYRSVTQSSYFFCTKGLVLLFRTATFVIVIFNQTFKV